MYDNTIKRTAMNLPDEIRQLTELGTNGNSEACHILGQWYALSSTLEDDLSAKVDLTNQSRDWFYKALCDKDYGKRADYGEAHCLQLYSQYAPVLLGDTEDVSRYCGYAEQLCQSLRYRYK